MALYHFTLPVAFFFGIWICFSTLVNRFFPIPPQLRRKRIVLLIGHPDDEAMFFAPTVLALMNPLLKNEFRIVCLSTGNAVGEGPIRVRELLHSARRLGIRSARDVQIIDDPRFEDGPKTDWKADDIATFLKGNFTAGPAGEGNTSAASPNGQVNTPTQRRNPATDEPEDASSILPEVILTFDEHGISQHPNHSACYHGAVRFLEQFPKSYPSSVTPPALFVLPTLPRWRKYLHIFDVPLTLLVARTRSPGSHAVLLSDSMHYLSAYGAMTMAHQTQMVWFRWGWVLLGRYMLLNELVQVKVAGEQKGRRR